MIPYKVKLPVPEFNSIWQIKRNRPLAPYQLELRYRVVSVSADVRPVVGFKLIGNKKYLDALPTFGHTLYNFYRHLEPANEPV